MESKINIFNYEAWLLDRYEGTISPENDALLTAFLLKHPTLDDNLEELVTLDSELIPYKLSENLKKTTPSEEENELMIRVLEGIETSEESNYLMQLVHSDEIVSKHFEAYQMTIIKADESLHFENKKLLRKPQILRMPISWAAAATAIGLILLTMFLNRPGENAVTDLAYPTTNVPETGIKDNPQAPELKDFSGELANELELSDLNKENESKRSNSKITKNAELLKYKPTYLTSNEPFLRAQSDDSIRQDEKYNQSAKETTSSQINTIDQKQILAQSEFLNDLPRISRFKSEGIYSIRNEDPDRNSFASNLKPEKSPVLKQNESESNLLNIAMARLKSEVPAINKAYQNVTTFAEAQKQIIEEEGFIEIPSIKNNKDNNNQELAIRIAGFEIGIMR